jgi:hypothetical protein
MSRAARTKVIVLPYAFADAKQPLTQPVGERAAVLAGESHRLERRRAVALGEALAIGAEQQLVVAIFGSGQAEQSLEQAVDVRRLEQVLAADDMRDALRRVVDSDGEMVRGGGVLASEDDVAMRQRIGAHRTGKAVVPK